MYQPAYLLTFTTYGTWLRGDARGSRRHGQRVVPSSLVLEHERSLLKYPPFVLDQAQRDVVTFAIEDYCSKKNQNLSALSVLSSHVHAVVTGASIEPGMMLNGFKSRATLLLRNSWELPLERRIWTRGGSVLGLHSERAVSSAVAYVVRHYWSI